MSEGVRSVVMPKWGLSMAQGKITEWLVSEGDRVEPGTEVAEVETDKISGVLESAEQGVVRALVAEVGQDVPVGAPVVIVAGEEVSDEEVARAVEQAREQVASGKPVAEAGPVLSAAEVDGRRVAYASMGSGEQTVVLVHGYGGDKNSWLFAQEPLAGSAVVHAVDLPGHGESSKDVGDGSLPTLAGAVLGVVERVGAQRVHLVGHSLGGAVVAAAAAADPARVASVTLVAPAGFGPEVDAAFLREFAEATSRRELKPVVAKLFADPEQVTRRLVDDLVKYLRLDGVREALRTLQGTLLDGDRQALDTPAVLESCPVPVTVLWGAQDRILPPPQRPVSGVDQWEVAEGVGHMLHMERPQLVREAVAARL